MTYVTHFSVKMPKEEADQLKEAIEESDFQYDSLNSFRGNGAYAEYVRHLIEEDQLPCQSEQ